MEIYFNLIIINFFVKTIFSSVEVFYLSRLLVIHIHFKYCFEIKIVIFLVSFSFLFIFNFLEKKFVLLCDFLIDAWPTKLLIQLTKKKPPQMCDAEEQNLESRASTTATMALPICIQLIRNSDCST